MNMKLELPILHKRLFGLIPRGDENPMPVTDLARTLNTDIRSVNSLVYDLVVRYGIPVCSYRGKPHNGIFIPVTEEQRASGLVSQKEQAKSQIKKINAIQSANLNIVQEYERRYPETKRVSFLIPYTQTELKM